MINSFFLVMAALLPAAILCVYIFKKDRVEKEPLWLLVRLFALGVLCCFPAAYIERIVIHCLEKLFAASRFIDEQGTVFMPTNVFYVYNFLKYFVGVALIEEALKWTALLYATRFDEEFNSLFDGIIYAVFVSIGFAAYENIFYVLQYGWTNAFMRGLLSVPGHMFFAVLMGYHYSFWHIADKAGRIERELQNEGVLPLGKTISGRNSMRLSFLMPVMAHGMYDFCCTLGTVTGTLVFYGFIILLYIYCFGKIRKMSAADAPDERYAMRMLLKKHPHLCGEYGKEHTY